MATPYIFRSENKSVPRKCVHGLCAGVSDCLSACLDARFFGGNVFRYDCPWGRNKKADRVKQASSCPFHAADSRRSDFRKTSNEHPPFHIVSAMSSPHHIWPAWFTCSPRLACHSYHSCHTAKFVHAFISINMFTESLFAEREFLQFYNETMFA